MAREFLIRHLAHFGTTGKRREVLQQPKLRRLSIKLFILLLFASLHVRLHCNFTTIPRTRHYCPHQFRNLGRCCRIHVSTRSTRNAQEPLHQRLLEPKVFSLYYFIHVHLANLI